MSLFNTPQQRQQQQQYQTNLNGVFTHSKAETILQRIQKSVERHEIEITSLRCDVDSSQAQLQNDIHTMNESLSTIKSQMDNLLQRIENIEQSIQIPGSPPSSNVTLGQVIIANRRTIAKTLNLVSQKVTNHEAKKLIRSEIEPMKVSLDSWKKDVASNDAIQKSNETISALINRVDLLANDMCNKVDRTLFKSISSDATCIKNYADFIRTTESTTKKIEKELESTIRPTLQLQNEKIQSLDDQGKRVEATVKKSCCTIDDYEKLNLSIQTILQDLECKANAISLTEIEHNQHQSMNHLTSMDDDIKTLYSAHETLAKYMTKRLDTLQDNQKDLVAMNNNECKDSNYVQRDDFNKIFKQLQSMLETKACKEILISLQQSIKDMESELSVTKRKADLSAQFVSWYGKKQDKGSSSWDSDVDDDDDGCMIGGK